MSVYTTQLRYVMEFMSKATESGTYLNLDNLISVARPLIFDFDYPHHNEQFKEQFETLFLMEYYNDEICCETIGLWRHRLRSKLNRIMPYYVQLLSSQDLEFDIFKNVDYDTTGSNTSNKTLENTEVTGIVNHETANTTSGAKSVHIDTPQGNNIPLDVSLINYYDSGEVGDSKTIVVTDGTSDQKTGKSGTENTTGSDTQHVVGKNNSDSYSKMLLEYRSTFINVLNDVIHECKDLFMVVR